MTPAAEKKCLRYDPFFGDETQVRLLRDQFVRTRFTHRCTICWGMIPAKVRIRAMTEVNLEDRQTKTFYFCEPCCAAMAISWRDAGLSIEARTAIGMKAVKNQRKDVHE